MPSANALSLEEKSDQREKTEDESFLYERNLVRLLAEVRFISGEVGWQLKDEILQMLTCHVIFIITIDFYIYACV